MFWIGKSRGGKVVGLIASIFFVIAGLSGEFVLIGTQSSEALVVVAGIFAVVNIFGLIFHKPENDIPSVPGGTGNPLALTSEGTKSCKNCRTTITCGKGYFAAKSKNIPEEAVMCEKCGSLFRFSLSEDGGSLFLLDDITEKYRELLTLETSESGGSVPAATTDVPAFTPESAQTPAVIQKNVNPAKTKKIMIIVCASAFAFVVIIAVIVGLIARGASNGTSDYEPPVVRRGMSPMEETVPEDVIPAQGEAITEPEQELPQTIPELVTSWEYIDPAALIGIWYDLSEWGVVEMSFSSDGSYYQLIESHDGEFYLDAEGTYVVDNFQIIIQQTSYMVIGDYIYNDSEEYEEIRYFIAAGDNTLVIGNEKYDAPLELDNITYTRGEPSGRMGTTRPQAPQPPLTYQGEFEQSVLTNGAVKTEFEYNGQQKLYTCEIDNNNLKWTKDLIPAQFVSGEPGDLGAIAILTKGELREIGNYTNGGVAYTQPYYIKLLDPFSGKIISERTFDDGYAPYIINGFSVTIPPDEKKIKKWLAEEWLKYALPNNTDKTLLFEYTTGFNNTITITDYYGEEFGHMNIPETIQGKTVVAIGYDAFQYMNFTGVTLPNTLTAIEDMAFFSCKALTEITIPDSVKTIGSSAFGGCFALRNITIGSGVTSFGGWAFSDCTSLTSIDIPDNVIDIGYETFAHCTALMNITYQGKTYNYITIEELYPEW